MALLELINTVAGVIVAIAALIGVVIGSIGLHTWRKEQRGRTRYEIAREVQSNR